MDLVRLLKRLVVDGLHQVAYQLINIEADTFNVGLYDAGAVLKFANIDWREAAKYLVVNLSEKKLRAEKIWSCIPEGSLTGRSPWPTWRQTTFTGY